MRGWGSDGVLSGNFRDGGEKVGDGRIRRVANATLPGGGGGGEKREVRESQGVQRILRE